MPRRPGIPLDSSVSGYNNAPTQLNRATMPLE